MTLSVAAILFFRKHPNLLHPRTPRGIVIHHTASPGKVEGHLVNAAMIDKWHAGRGFWKEYKGHVYHIGYHYVIRADGVIERGRPLGCRGAHASKGNDCIGICLVGDFMRKARGKVYPSHPTHAQMAALRHLLKVLVAKYHFTPAQIHAHREIGDTDCPGDQFPIGEVREWVKEFDQEESLAWIFK